MRVIEPKISSFPQWVTGKTLHNFDKTYSRCEKFFQFPKQIPPAPPVYLIVDLVAIRTNRLSFNHKRRVGNLGGNVIGERGIRRLPPVELLKRRCVLQGWMGISYGFVVVFILRSVILVLRSWLLFCAVQLPGKFIHAVHFSTEFLQEFFLERPRELVRKFPCHGHRCPENIYVWYSEYIDGKVGHWKRHFIICYVV